MYRARRRNHPIDKNKYIQTSLDDFFKRAKNEIVQKAIFKKDIVKKELAKKGFDFAVKSMPLPKKTRKIKPITDSDTDHSNESWLWLKDSTSSSDASETSWKNNKAMKRKNKFPLIDFNTASSPEVCLSSESANSTDTEISSIASDAETIAKNMRRKATLIIESDSDDINENETTLPEDKILEDIGRRNVDSEASTSIISPPKKVSLMQVTKPTYISNKVEKLQPRLLQKQSSSFKENLKANRKADMLKKQCNIEEDKYQLYPSQNEHMYYGLKNIYRPVNLDLYLEKTIAQTMQLSCKYFGRNDTSPDADINSLDVILKNMQELTNLIVESQPETTPAKDQRRNIPDQNKEQCTTRKTKCGNDEQLPDAVGQENKKVQRINGVGTKRKLKGPLSRRRPKVALINLPKSQENPSPVIQAAISDTNEATKDNKKSGFKRKIDDSESSPSRSKISNVNSSQINLQALLMTSPTVNEAEKIKNQADDVVNSILIDFEDLGNSKLSSIPLVNEAGTSKSVVPPPIIITPESKVSATLALTSDKGYVASVSTSTSDVDYISAGSITISDIGYASAASTTTSEAGVSIPPISQNVATNTILNVATALDSGSGVVDLPPKSIESTPISDVGLVSATPTMDKTPLIENDATKSNVLVSPAIQTVASKTVTSPTLESILEAPESSTIQRVESTPNISDSSTLASMLDVPVQSIFPTLASVSSIPTTVLKTINSSVASASTLDKAASTPESEIIDLTSEQPQARTIILKPAEFPILHKLIQLQRVELNSKIVSQKPSALLLDVPSTSNIDGSNPKPVSNIAKATADLELAEDDVLPPMTSTPSSIAEIKLSLLKDSLARSMPKPMPKMLPKPLPNLLLKPIPKLIPNPLPESSKTADLSPQPIPSTSTQADVPSTSNASKLSTAVSKPKMSLSSPGKNQNESTGGIETLATLMENSEETNDDCNESISSDTTEICDFSSANLADCGIYVGKYTRNEQTDGEDLDGDVTISVSSDDDRDDGNTSPMPEIVDKGKPKNSTKTVKVLKKLKKTTTLRAQPTNKVATSKEKKTGLPLQEASANTPTILNNLEIVPNASDRSSAIAANTRIPPKRLGTKIPKILRKSNFITELKERLNAAIAPKELETDTIKPTTVSATKNVVNIVESLIIGGTKKGKKTYKAKFKQKRNLITDKDARDKKSEKLHNPLVVDSNTIGGASNSTIGEIDKPQSDPETDPLAINSPTLISTDDDNSNDCATAVIPDSDASEESIPAASAKRKKPDKVTEPPKPTRIRIRLLEEPEELEETTNSDDGDRASSPECILPDDETINFDFLEKPSKALRKLENGDSCSMKELRKIMKHVYQSPNLYSVLYEQEIKMLYDFFTMEPPYQYVCFKLFTRLPKWYNMISFVNIELKMALPEDKIIEMQEFLKEKKFINSDYSQERPADLLNGLLKDDIKDIFSSFKIKSKKALTKEEYITAILNYCNQQTTLTVDKNSKDVLMDKIKNKMKNGIKLDHTFHYILFRLHLLYSFTNPELLNINDLYRYMNDIETEKIVLPKYTIDYSPIFMDKTEFDGFSKATECFHEYNIAKEKKQKKTMADIMDVVYKELKKLIDLKVDISKKPNFLKKFTAGSVFANTLTLGCQDFTTEDYKKVITWLNVLLQQNQYAISKKGKWYLLLAMIYEKYDDNIESAVETIVKGLKDEQTSLVYKHDLSTRGYSIKKKKNMPTFKSLKDSILLDPPDKVPFKERTISAQAQSSNQPGRKRLYVTQNDTGEKSYKTVEDIASDHYIKKGFNAMHCEGNLIASLFTLIFWDIIYDVYVPGAFISEIQSVPLDLFSKQFYTNRKKKIDSRLSEVRRDSNSNMEILQALVLNRKYHEKKLSIAAFDEFSITVLCDALTAIGPTVLYNIFKRIIMNFRDYRAGMPDLFVWNACTKTCKFVEVKGQNDKLSTKQKLWLQYLGSVNACAEVCHVHTIGSKATAKKNTDSE